MLARLVGLRLELLAQMPDVHVDRAGIAIGAVSPDRAEQLLAVQQPAGSVISASSSSKLRKRQPHRLAVHRDLALARSSVIGPTSAVRRRARGSLPPQDRTDPAAELRRPNGLVT